MYIEVKDLGNGGEAATAFFLYLNTYSSVNVAFCNEMMLRGSDIKQNFTLLCVEWLKALAGQNVFDDRNEASVIYARNVGELLDDSDMPARKELSARYAPKEFAFSPDDHAGAAEFMEHYLRRCKTNDDFINAALRSHRTLQQAFTRLCCKWFSMFAEVSSRKKYVKLAKKVDTLRRGFPFI